MQQTKCPLLRSQVNAFTALQQLQGLMARLPAGYLQRLSALDQLSVLRSLNKLAVELPGSKELSCKQVAQLLASVQHVRSVKLYVPAGRVAAAQQVVLQARQANSAQAVEGPADVRVAAIDPEVDYDE
jgi:hypothetical protein